MAHIKATNTPPAKVLKNFAALMFFILGMAALNAKTAAWKGPEQFVLINGIDMEYNWAAIREHFGPMEGKKIAVGGAFIVYCFERDENFLEEEIREHLKQAQENVLPVLVQLDTITFMTARPDLWNWWDESKPGYNPENVSNVEWTGWSPKDAVKIGWLNWGEADTAAPDAQPRQPAIQGGIGTPAQKIHERCQGMARRPARRQKVAACRRENHGGNLFRREQFLLSRRQQIR